MVENMILNLIHQDSHIGNTKLKTRNMKNDVAALPTNLNDKRFPSLAFCRVEIPATVKLV